MPNVMLSASGSAALWMTVARPAMLPTTPSTFIDRQLSNSTVDDGLALQSARGTYTIPGLPAIPTSFGRLRLRGEMVFLSRK